MIETVKITYKIKFVNGTLKGLDYDNVTTVPLSCVPREVAYFRKAIKEQTVIKAFGRGSDYKIVSYEVVV